MKTHLCTNILQEMFSSEQQQLQTISPNKKRRLNGAMKTSEKDNLAIFYQLSDIDVIEDWALIQTSLQQSTIMSDDSDNDSESSDNNCLVLMPNADYFKEEGIDCDKN
jgi:hypothetical protein